MKSSEEPPQNRGFNIIGRCLEAQTGFQILTVLCVGLLTLYFSQATYNVMNDSSFGYISQRTFNEQPVPKSYNLQELPRTGSNFLEPPLPGTRQTKPFRPTSFHANQDTSYNKNLTEGEWQNAIMMTEHWRQHATLLDDKVRIVYNRVPKCASRTVKDVVKVMASRGQYNFKSSRNWVHYNLTKWGETKSQTRELYNLKSPLFFDRHFWWTNFTQYTHKKQPFYINVVREPISHYVSFYYFYRTKSRHRNELFTAQERAMTLGMLHIFVCKFYSYKTILSILFKWFSPDRQMDGKQCI